VPEIFDQVLFFLHMMSAFQEYRAFYIHVTMHRNRFLFK